MKNNCFWDLCWEREREREREREEGVMMLEGDEEKGCSWYPGTHCDAPSLSLSPFPLAHAHTLRRTHTHAHTDEHTHAQWRINDRVEHKYRIEWKWIHHLDLIVSRSIHRWWSRNRSLTISWWTTTTTTSTTTTTTNSLQLIQFSLQKTFQYLSRKNIVNWGRDRFDWLNKFWSLSISNTRVHLSPRPSVRSSEEFQFESEDASCQSPPIFRKTYHYSIMPRISISWSSRQSNTNTKDLRQQQQQ